MIALKRNTSSNKEMTELYKNDKDFRTLIKFIKEIKKDFTWEEIEVLLSSDMKLSSTLEKYVLGKINKVYFSDGQKSEFMLKRQYKLVKDYLMWLNI